MGGASNSQHIKGTACDITVDGVPPKQVAAYIEAHFPNTGIGLYNNFVHVDTRVMPSDGRIPAATQSDLSGLEKFMKSIALKIRLRAEKKEKRKKK